MSSTAQERTGPIYGLFTLFITGIFGGGFALMLTILRDQATLGKLFKDGIVVPVENLDAAKGLFSAFMLLCMAVGVTFVTLIYQLDLAIRRRKLTGFALFNILVSLAITGVFIYFVFQRWQWPELLWSYLPVAVVLLIVGDEQARNTLRLERTLALNSRHEESYDQLLDGLGAGATTSAPKENIGSSRVLPPEDTPFSEALDVSREHQEESAEAKDEIPSALELGIQTPPAVLDGPQLAEDTDDLNGEPDSAQEDREVPEEDEFEDATSGPILFGDPSRGTATLPVPEAGPVDEAEEREAKPSTHQEVPIRRAEVAEDEPEDAEVVEVSEEPQHAVTEDVEAEEDNRPRTVEELIRRAREERS